MESSKFQVKRTASFISALLRSHAYEQVWPDNVPAYKGAVARWKRPRDDECGTSFKGSTAQNNL